MFLCKYYSFKNGASNTNTNNYGNQQMHTKGLKILHNIKFLQVTAAGAIFSEFKLQIFCKYVTMPDKKHTDTHYMD
jgi:hypothetical protein